MTDSNEWRGAVDNVWAREWRRTDRAFNDLTVRLNAAVAAAAPQGAGRALDIGCGAGETSIKLAKARPDLTVTGGDLSADLLAVARRRGEGIANLAFVEGDAREVADRIAPVDLYLSRHGVMFFDDPGAAFGQLHAAASDDAALVFTCFRAPEENPAFTEIYVAVAGETPAIPAPGPGPFAFADRDATAKLLMEAGWRDVTIAPLDYTHVAGSGSEPLADALAYFRHIGPAARLLRSMNEADQTAALERVARVCERYRAGDSIDFPGAAWLCSARAA